MHNVLVNIQSNLEKITSQLRSVISNDEPFGNLHNNWSFPGLTRTELIQEVQSLIDLIEIAGSDEIGECEPHLTDYIRRLQFLQQHTIPNLPSNPAAGILAFTLTLNGLRKALSPILTGNESKDSIIKLKKLTSQVRALEARLKDIQPRADTLAGMVDRIENAYHAADQLPTDLESLAEARERIEGLVQQATKDHVRLVDMCEQANLTEDRLKESASNAEAVLERCETAYSAATSVGLAAAFSERSAALGASTWVWVGGLVAALVAGSFFGAGRLQALVESLKDPSQPQLLIIPNLILSLVSLGAPIWFAWLSTKQIGQRFKLAEDYAFKASVARAYEGFRREAARVDTQMEARLLASALARLDELPLRLVETENHGSPWHDLATSDVVKQALKTAPGFAAQVKDLAERAMSSVPTVRNAKASSKADDEE